MKFSVVIPLILLALTSCYSIPEVKPEPSLDEIRTRFTKSKVDFVNLGNLVLADEKIVGIYLNDEGILSFVTRGNEISKLQAEAELEKVRTIMRKLPVLCVYKQWNADEPKKSYVCFRFWDNSIPTFDPQREKGLIYSKDLPKSLFFRSVAPQDSPDLKFVPNSDLMPVEGKDELILLTQLEPCWWSMNYRHRNGAR
ncbi:hypothetical protein KA183_20840 [bacterium]|nr:hypothetical protein [bacterium]